MSVSGVERILRELADLNDEVEASLTPPADITDCRGQVWTWWKGDLYRNGKGSAVPRAFLVD